MVLYHFLLGETEDGENTQTSYRKHLLQVCWLASLKAPTFLYWPKRELTFPDAWNCIQERCQKYLEQAANAHLWLRCTMKGEKAEERGLSKRKSWSGGKEGGEGKRNYNQKCIGFLSYCKWDHFRGWEQKCLHLTDTMHNFRALLPSIWYRFSWSYLWSTHDSMEQSPAESNIGPSAFVLSCPLPHDAIRLKLPAFSPWVQGPECYGPSGGLNSI